MVEFESQGIYTINNEKQEKFIANKMNLFGSDKLYLGGKHDATEYLNGSISSFEHIESEERLPADIRNLIVQDQMNNSTSK